MTPRTVHLLCAGAAQGLVRALQARLADEHGATIAGRFGAVGGLKEALLAGEPCDLMVTTDAMVDELVQRGALRGVPRAALGRVRTGIAVCAGAPRPDVSSPDALQATLLAADAVYLPDPTRATAGIHFAKVLRTLGIDATLQPRLRAFASGAIAMRELAAAGTPRSIGCTQLSEILYTKGVDLVAPLPARFELATVYSAAVGAQALEPALAAALLALLAGPQAAALRRDGGFE